MQDWFNTSTIGSGTGPELGRDSGGECGVPTAWRFKMPTPPTPASAAPGDAPYWYSFDHGPAHFVMVNTELPLVPANSPGPSHHPPSPQWLWLTADLKAVNRRLTPWVIVMGHRPIFIQSPLATLLYDYGVDLTIAGHVHYAQRTCPLKGESCMQPGVEGGYDGVVHVVAGNGGQALNNATNNGFPTVKFPYVGSGCNWNMPGANCSASQKLTGGTQGSGTEFGMSAFVANSTTLRYAFIGNNDSTVHYHFNIRRAYPRLPPPPPTPLPPTPTPSPHLPPNPIPSPPPPGTKWDCHAGMLASLPLVDADLTKPPFGTANSTVETCEQMCNGAKGCVVVNWHGGTVNHCHVMTGKAPTHASFLLSLRNNSVYTACMRA
eukprot:SAG31_NODE_1823_length_7191_cov_9.623519_5_plen_377_part_00